MQDAAPGLDLTVYRSLIGRLLARLDVISGKIRTVGPTRRVDAGVYPESQEVSWPRILELAWRKPDADLAMRRDRQRLCPRTTTTWEQAGIHFPISASPHTKESPRSNALRRNGICAAPRCAWRKSAEIVFRPIPQSP